MRAFLPLHFFSASHLLRVRFARWGARRLLSLSLSFPLSLPSHCSFPLTHSIPYAPMCCIPSLRDHLTMRKPETQNPFLPLPPLLGSPTGPWDKVGTRRKRARDGEGPSLKRNHQTSSAVIGELHTRDPTLLDKFPNAALRWIGVSARRTPSTKKR